MRRAWVLLILLACWITTAEAKDDRQKLSADVQLVETAEGTALSFPVTHMHSGGFAGRCYGYLQVSAERIRYVVNPGKHAAHGFDFPRDEFRAVDIPSFLGIKQEFILKFRSGTYRMVHVTKKMVDGEYSGLRTRANMRDPDEVQWAIQNLAGAVAAAGGTLAVRGQSAAREAAGDDWDTPLPAAVGGIYRLERKLNFNVLDGAYFDPAAGQVTLFGHQDARYRGMRIPYLQHLAALLENPRPEFTLEWTPDSEKRVNAFLAQKETRADAQRAAKSMAAFLDANGRVNETGKLLLPGWGITATFSGGRLGYLGVKVEQVPDGQVRVTSVDRGSPAEAAGLARGDVIWHTTYGEPLTPEEFYRKVKILGEGEHIGLSIHGKKYTGVKLGGQAGDPWSVVTREDVVERLLYKAGKSDAGRTLKMLTLTERVAWTPGWVTSIAALVSELGIMDVVRQVNADAAAGRISEAQQSGIVNRAICERAAAVFEIDAQQVTRAFDNTLNRSRNYPEAAKACYAELYASMGPLINHALSAVRAKAEGVQIAPELIERTWGVHPEVVPKYLGVRPDTQLARAMLAGDYLGKRLVNMPELKAKFPDYQTQYEFLQRHPQFDRERAAYRMWISVDKFRAAQSPDRSTFEVREIGMRFNLREIGAGGRNLPPQPGSYGELLSRMYDDLAREFFVLHELREAAKLAGIAQWILAREPGFRMPAEGRARWQSPAKLPGLVFAYLGGGNDNGTAPMTIFATGGVALTPYEWSGQADLETLAPTDPSVVDLRGLASPQALGGGGLPVLEPPRYKNETLARVLHRPLQVPEWRPEGWVGKASKGARTLQFVSARRGRQDCDSIAQADVLRKLERAALDLDRTEQLINRVNQISPRLQQEIAEMSTELAKDRERFIEDAAAMLAGNLLEVRAFMKNRRAAGAVGWMAHATELDEQFETWEKRLAAAGSGDTRQQMDALASVLAELRDALADLNSPRAAALRELLGPFAWYEDAKEMADALETFATLMIFQNFDVERLTREVDARNAALAAIEPLHKKQLQKVDQLRKDPALQMLCAPPPQAVAAGN